MSKIIDETGNVYGRLTVLECAESDKRSKKLWSCICECGANSIVSGSNLRNGHTKSCGCLSVELSDKRLTTHGMTGTRIYEIWSRMIGRCLNTNNQDFHNYGGRGITICPEWVVSFEQFYADMGNCPEGFSLDRKDNENGYFKDNCRWATKAEQAQNRRSSTMNEVAVKVIRYLHGQGRSINDLAKAYNSNYANIWSIVSFRSWKNIKTV